MKHTGFALLAAALAAAAMAAQQRSARVAAVAAQIEAGDFRAAEQSIEQTFRHHDLPYDERQALEFERERMRRIRLDFPLTRAQMETQLRQAVPDLRAEELAAWDSPQKLESLRIDGEARYFKSAVNNLFRIDATAAARRNTPLKSSEGPLYRLASYHEDVRRLALEQKRRHVAPRRVTVRYELAVDADAVPAGEIVRAWLPFPRALPGQQEQLRLLTSEPAEAKVAPESALQRTVFLQRKAEAGKPTRFAIDYELVVQATYVAIDPARVRPARATRELAPFLAERAPHIVFTPALRRYSREIVGAEKNPYRIAQKLFAAVDTIPWAVAREYSTIPNISDYALNAGHADCGQQTLLLIALLRLNGIPARWQSGWEFDDANFDTMHDWGWLYLEPYGWVPMDVTHGRLQTRDPALEWFYLGGLDGYRIAFNDDYGREFVPPKQHMRSETVDLQRGEVEWNGGNLYFDQWGYRFRWQVQPVAADAVPTAALRHYQAGLEPAF